MKDLGARPRLRHPHRRRRASFFVYPASQRRRISIRIANYISEGGQPLEGFGLTPDQEVKLTRHQLLEGQDPVIDAAVTWIEKQKK